MPSKGRTSLFRFQNGQDLRSLAIYTIFNRFSSFCTHNVAHELYFPNQKSETPFPTSKMLAVACAGLRRRKNSPHIFHEGQGLRSLAIYTIFDRFSSFCTHNVSLELYFPNQKPETPVPTFKMLAVACEIHRKSTTSVNVQTGKITNSSHFLTH